MADEMTMSEIRQLIRQRAHKMGGMLALARSIGLHDSTLHNILSRKSTVGPRVLAALGLHAVSIASEGPVTTEPVEPVREARPYRPMWQLGDWPVFKK